MNDRKPARPLWGSDRYARIALGSDMEPGTSFADSDLFVAARGFQESIIPGFDSNVLCVVGDDEKRAAQIQSRLLGPRRGRDLWSGYSFVDDLHMYLEQLLRRGEVFIHYAIERIGAQGSYDLIRTTWLAPETLLRRNDRGQAVLEQFVSKRAFKEDGYVALSEPGDRIVEIPVDEVLALHWPLAEPGANPGKVVRKLGLEVAASAHRALANARAGAEPGETFLPLAKARVGAYCDALDEQKTLSARIKDMLLYPGAYEAEVLPWVDEVTDYFMADRMLRARVAICQVREYLLREFNSQVLDRWCALNGWSALRLQIRPVLFTEDDWNALRAGLDNGDTTLADVRAAIAAEAEEGR